jgi:mannose-6-phosphate isomerase-like protein (cupin superfamily)
LNLQEATSLRALDVEQLLAENPLRDGEDLKITTLSPMEGMSHHLVQIRTREVPHFHQNHDLTVFMLRANGFLMLEGKRIDLKTNDVMTIRRGAVHYYVNEDSRLAVVFAVYAPAFDGKDFVPVKE